MRIERDPKPSNDDILYVGMSTSAATEAGALRHAAAAHVTAITPSSASTLEGCDMTTDAGVDAFVDTLDLAPAQHGAVKAALLSTSPGARDEMAQIAEVWAHAEHGRTIPSRLVLSGHGSGGEVHGEGTPGLSFGALGQLARAMPRAAAQVEDVFVSACFQGQPERLRAFVDMFPNLKTANGYTDFAPSNDVAGIARWETMTRGHVETRVPLHEGGSWTKSRGYAGEVPSSLARAEVSRLDVFDAYFRGDAVDRDAHRGPLASYYSALQHLAGSRELPESERAACQARIFQTACLRFYDKTRGAFARDHASAIQDGYAALGVSAPRFATMSRKDALDAIADVDRRVQSTRAPSREALDLQRALHGLRDLDPNFVRWT